MKKETSKIVLCFLLATMTACFGPSSMLEDTEESKSSTLSVDSAEAEFSEVCPYDGKTYHVVQGYIDCMIEGSPQKNPTAQNMQCGNFTYNLYDSNDSSAYINCKVQEAMANVPSSASFSKECDGTIYKDPDLWAKCVQDLAAVNQNKPVPPQTPSPTTPTPLPKPSSDQGNTSCILKGEKTLLGLFHDCSKGGVNKLFCKYECKLNPCKEVETYKTSNVRTGFDLFAIKYKVCQADLNTFPGDPRGVQCNAQCKK